MPLTGSVKNQIATQIETVFDAIDAGTAWDNPDWIHQSWTFTSNGRRFDVQVLPEGNAQFAEVVLRIKRIPL